MIFILIVACSGDKLDTADSVEEDAYPHDIAQSCHESVLEWNDSWMGLEFATLDEINRRRAEPADCRTQGTFNPAPPLEMDPYLHCSARFHSFWMGQNGVLEHDSPGGDLGEDPWERMTSAGFTGFGTGENVAAGYSSPADVVEGWMNSDGHCSIIMDPNAEFAGLGYYFIASGYSHYWTLNTGVY